MLVVLLNLVCVFVAAHITVDPEFNNSMKAGAYAVISVIAIIYLLTIVL